ncbi:MAG: metallophosphoesterase [Sedimentisphaerales bacterium]|nr:metallophosphoesterase [Sedimentisphaerales bacterium]
MHSNRLLISAIAAWMLAVPTCLAGGSWRFAVTGDSRGGLETGVNETALCELAHELLHRDIDFLIFPGDLVYGAGVSPREFERQLREWTRVMRPLYDAGIPVYLCRGNHEIGDMWYALPDEVPDPNDNYGQRWLWVFGNDDCPTHRLPDNGPAGEKYMTYSVVHKNALVVGLDQYGGTNYSPLHYVNQQWLDSQLESNVKPHVFAFGHEEAFRTLHYDCMDAHPDRRDAFWWSLEAAGARTYFCCHDHYYDHARVDDGDGDPNNDIHQFIVATAGAPLYTWTPPYDGNNGDFSVEQVRHVEGRYGYVLVNVNDLNVTTVWMERADMNSISPPLYVAGDVWSYTVSPNVVVLRPRPGERVPAGQPYTVRWKTIEGAQVKQVIVEYSLDGGANWLVAGDGKNSGTFVWSTPMENSDSCLVRIVGVGNPKIDDTTDGTFSLCKCTSTLAADLNGDCRVDFADLSVLADEWLADTSMPDPPPAPEK